LTHAVEDNLGLWGNLKIENKKIGFKNNNKYYYLHPCCKQVNLLSFTTSIIFIMKENLSV